MNNPNAMINLNTLRSVQCMDITRILPQAAYHRVERVSGRLLSCAEILNAEQTLGWMLDCSDSPSLQMFHSPSLRMDTEDYRWILEDFAEAMNTDSPVEIPSADSVLYVLCDRRLTNLSCEDTPDADELDVPLCFHDLLPAQRNACLELFRELNHQGAKLRLLLDGSHLHSGLMLLELKNTMPLRIRAMLSNMCPHIHAREITRTEKNTCCLKATDWCHAGWRYLFSTIFLNTYASAMLDKYEEERIANHSFEDNDSIDLLQLSVRTYNTLRRGGVHTIGDLRQRPWEELISIRNFGRRCQEELRDTLQSLGIEVPDSAPMKSPAANTASNAAEPVLVDDNSLLADDSSLLTDDDPQPTSMEMLNELIGLSDVKEQVMRISAFARLKKDMAARDMKEIPLSLHMSFEGNPGTAKTTVARIMAGILHEQGILPSSEIHEVGRSDLVGPFVGHTAERVKAVFEKAEGKLLFIDEAYSLADDHRGSFADEAIATIVQEMENHRNTTVVVFAGYPEEMKKFFSLNPGLDSRVPFHINFPDYSADEMLSITRLESRRRGFTLCPEAEGKVKELCAKAIGNATSGNGRFCRNLVENAILNYAARVYNIGGEDDSLDFTLTEADFTIPCEMVEAAETKKAPIGFHVAR